MPSPPDPNHFPLQDRAKYILRPSLREGWEWETRSYVVNCFFDTKMINSGTVTIQTYYRQVGVQY